MKLLKQYTLYLIRWQLSTPILAVVLILLTNTNQWVATIIANLIGGLLFFWVDKFIFKSSILTPRWEIKEDAECADCGHKGHGYRIVEWMSYDKSKDKEPKYRCHDCREEKFKKVENLVKNGA